MPGGGASMTNWPPQISHWLNATQAMWCDSGLSVKIRALASSCQSRAMSRAFDISVLAECITHFGGPVVPEVKAR